MQCQAMFKKKEINEWGGKMKERGVEQLATVCDFKIGFYKFL